MSSPEPEDIGQHPAVRMHVAICLVALLVLLVNLLLRGFGSWSLFPALVGALGVAQRWRSAPLILLVALVGFISIETVVYSGWQRQVQVPRFRLGDWVLCGAVLAYIVAYYRLQGLVGCIFPPDPRLRESEGRRFLFFRMPPKLIEHRRSASQVTSWETTWLLVSLPVWATLAQVIWLLLPTSGGQLGLPPRAERTLALIWLVGVLLFCGAGLLSYWNISRASPTEASLLLQDADWRETCREQRRIHRWMIWRRLQRRRKEKS